MVRNIKVGQIRNGLLHVKQKLMHSHLSKELREKYKKRSLGLRKGDKIKIMKGKFKKHEGKVERVDLKKTIVFIDALGITKRDGSKKLIGLTPSNLMITELNLEDKFRQKILDRKTLDKNTLDKKTLTLS